MLQLSGIGPGALLRELGLPVIHELPGVGENLHDHLQVRLVYKVKNVLTLNQRANSLSGRVSMGLEYLLFKTGPLTMPPSQLGAFARSDPSRASANIEWHAPLSLDKFASRCTRTRRSPVGVQSAAHRPGLRAHQSSVRSVPGDQARLSFGEEGPPGRSGPAPRAGSWRPRRWLNISRKR
jgi:choline dehydrogenase-like flavoprotein